VLRSGRVGRAPRVEARRLPGARPTVVTTHGVPSRDTQETGSRLTDDVQAARPESATDPPTRPPQGCVGQASRVEAPADSPGRALPGVWWTSRAVGRVLSRVLVAGDAVTVIHLGWPLPTTSSALPACSGGPPSNARCLGLLRMGFTEPTWSPRSLVVSYTTVSPLPRSLARPGRSVFCGTVPRVAPGGCWPPSCPSEPGPSSAVVAHRRDRPPDSSAASVGVGATRTRRPPRRRARRRGRAAPTGGTRARRGDP
jgi:hypothetical protein